MAPPAIEFRDVSFRRPDRPGGEAGRVVIEHLSLLV
jgi:hypothetical protein